MKKIVSFLVAATMLFSLSSAALAVETTEPVTGSVSDNFESYFDSTSADYGHYVTKAQAQTTQIDGSFGTLHTIAYTDDHSWLLEGYSSKTRAWLQDAADSHPLSKCLYLSDCEEKSPCNVLLDVTDVPGNQMNVNSLRFDMVRQTQHSRSSMKVLVGESKVGAIRECIEFGISRFQDKDTSNTDISGKMYAALIENNGGTEKRTLLGVADNVEWIGSSSLYPTGVHWDITVENNTVSWTATLPKSDGTSTTWTSSYTNEVVSELNNNMEYPCAFSSSAYDNQTWYPFIKNVNLDYTVIESEPVVDNSVTITDNFRSYFDSSSADYNHYVTEAQARETQVGGSFSAYHRIAYTADHEWLLDGASEKTQAWLMADTPHNVDYCLFINNRDQVTPCNVLLNVLNAPGSQMNVNSLGVRMVRQTSWARTDMRVLVGESEAGNIRRCLEFGILGAYETNANKAYVALVEPNGGVEKRTIIEVANNVEWPASSGDAPNGMLWAIDIKDNTVSWTATLPKKDGTSATWTSSYTNEIVSEMNNNMEYPCAFNARTNGTNPWYPFITDVILNYTPKEVSPTDAITWSDLNFKGYSGSVVSAALDTQDPTVLGAKKGASWTSSGVWYGGDSATGAHNSTYINNALYLKGWGTGWMSTDNLDFGEQIDFDNIDNLQFTTDHTNGALMSGMMMFVSSDEKTYYMFGYRNIRENAFESKFMPGSTYRVPFVAKSVDGVISVVDYAGMGDETVANWGSGTLTSLGTDNKVVLNWDISTEGNVLSWTVSDNFSNTWTDTYTDDAGIVRSSYRYPVAYAAMGDNLAKLLGVKLDYTVLQEKEYANDNYTYSEFLDMYNEAVATGKDKYIKKVLNLDLSDQITNTASGTFSVNPETAVNTSDKNMLGINLEYDNFNRNAFFKADGSFTDEFNAIVNEIHPISSVRFGGSSSNKVNMLNAINGTPSNYVSLPSDFTEGISVGDQASAAYSMSIIDWIKIVYATNPNASFIPCISMLTTTPEDTAELVKILTSTESTYVTRRANLGLSKPVNIDYFELTNEIDEGSWSQARADWYTAQAKSHIAAIKAANPDIKILACGPTAPWVWKDTYKNWINEICDELGDTIDAMSFHPYYYGYSAEEIMDNWIAEIKNTIDAKITSKDIKIVLTEHAIDWGTKDSVFTVSTAAALTESYFLSKAKDVDYIDGAYIHSFYGPTPLWSLIRYSNNEFIGSVTEKAYNEVSENYAANQVSSTLSMDSTTPDVGWATISDINKVITADASVDAYNRLVITFTNMAAYTAADIDFTIGGNYQLTQSRVFKAPNLFTYAYDNSILDNVTTTVNNYDTPEALTSFNIPAMSITTLVLEKPQTGSMLNEQFAYSDTVVNGIDVPVDTIQDIVTNSNGTKWTIDANEIGYYQEGANEYGGTAAISNNNLVLTSSSADAETLAAGWDVSGYADSLNGLNEISFALTDTAGNGKITLFDNYDFTNQMADYTGKVTWTVTVGENTLSWRATDGNTVKTGTMPYTAAAYDYLAKVSITGTGTVTLDYITGLYEESSVQGVVYTNNADTITGTFTPSVYNDPAAILYAAFYTADGKTLVDVAKTTDTSFTIAKPADFVIAKIMVWNAQQKALTDVIPVE